MGHFKNLTFDFISLVFAPYIGTGTYDIDVEVDQWQDFGGISGIKWAITPVSASGYVTIDYNFIPEPAKIAILGLGGLLLRNRRFHQRCKRKA